MPGAVFSLITRNPQPHNSRVEKAAMATAEHAAVEVRVDDIAQLFDTLDPYPFPERDLSRDAEDYIVGWARELAAHRPITIAIHYPNTPHQEHAFHALKQAMVGFFAARSRSIQRDLNELFRVGRYSLAIGAVSLIACLLLAQLATRLSLDPPLGRLIEESFLILGWVANWRPLEIFLYEWWPLVRNRNLYRRLAEARIEERPYDPGMN
ncbi:hypothetical protein [Taklimakanibacter deserti]|uniref:hypothetical protein n=1 Tax=Taklimakanibacter deserti TaxID=2267839 RepID=UPI0034D51CE2